ncbi:porin [Sphingomonas silueang]|uniref:porin n=1 Tax=Sphingomonas silueang TaxID=3156617 RepID=UPI0032B4139A
MQHLFPATLAVSILAASPAPAQTVQDLQRQIDELKAVIAEMKAERAQVAAPAPVAAAPTSPPPAPERLAAAPVPKRKPWYERITLRGYTQLRLNEILSGDRTAPDGVARLRSVHDGGIGDNTGFTFRRIRLVLQGDLNDRVSFYLQPDFAQNVANQSVGERREGFLQLRDAYADVFLDADKRVRLRFGQSKIPYGWEDLQSSGNRLTLDRADAINSAVPSERDIGVVAYYTPAATQAIWDRLGKEGQKLFGNYGAFGLGVFNGQGVNREESNDAVMVTAMATWPFALDGLGGAFAGQVLEVGGSALHNRVQPELRGGGVSAVPFTEERIALHAILYPQPFGLQAEWNWGRGPEYDRALRRIVDRRLSGGYVQAMARVARSPLGPFMPYARWQRYEGGWKAALNAPPLDTEEVELGIEFHPWEPIELTIAYAEMERAEADERRIGRAEGSLLRTQLQWNY